MVLPSLLVMGALAYAAGSIPVHRFLGLSDYDDGHHGSRRLRSLTRFLLNVIKGLVVVEIGCLYDPGVALATAIGISLGHNYPIWTTFRGGTGLGVIVGALFALQPLLGIIAVSVWGSAYYVFRKRAIAAGSAAVMTPYLASSITLPFSALALVPLSVLVLWRHRHAIIEGMSSGPKETEDAFRNL